MQEVRDSTGETEVVRGGDTAGLRKTEVSQAARAQEGGQAATTAHHTVAVMHASFSPSLPSSFFLCLSSYPSLLFKEVPHGAPMPHPTPPPCDFPHSLST